ncbi:thiamine-monophosphate kinase [Catalinimonas alkaloidigena]|uniref:Thiamine-monophosphate kinase n=1 Tax=Catalinimonas alkaloidigena TaxID=1075417 RepID=A0A1G9PMU2_9BACT|nr:thiamine-phosphate kinase [Catalinimonas alkaloidigena]SDL99405.1 thiamine-monophosphate kinase [Catalinimonas alkaloidigena]
MTEEKRTEIAAIGEFGLIDRLQQQITLQQESTVYGIGDDAAVIQTGELCTVVTTDLLTEGVHFDLRYVPLRHLGYKAVAVNVSDVAAMNAIPRQITVSMALSNRFSVEAVEELYAGIRLACEQYKVDLVGGDTTASGAGLTLSVTALGTAAPHELVYRNGARVGDVICVSGDLGAAYMGLQVLEREKEVFIANPNMQPQLESYEYIVGRQLKPEARMDLIHELRELGIRPTAMIDISDGLASELFHISHRSGVGIAINEDKIPVAEETGRAADEFRIDATTCALNGGEDYELLFTLDPADYERISKETDITAIGLVRKAEEGLYLITRGSNRRPLQAQGWQHFKKK